ncbi:MAG TPA: DUF664 domain-containing protein [Thermoflexia bacterium]|jgi:hypothetical protein|nr:DUF664 domain-containing protein [Thermoflexia bacterium]
MKEQTLSDEQILSLFVASAERLRALVEDLSEADLDLRSEPGGWTIRQIVHHVADDGDVWSMCIKKAIATPGALVRFEGFPGNEAWAQALDFEGRDIGPAVDLVVAHRRYLAEMLRHFASGWDRSVRLANSAGEVRREMTVREMVRVLAEHLLEHVEVIERTRARRGRDD